MGHDARAPFSWPVRVYWEDTDGGGVVYHARYLHFFERARTEWLRHLGFAQSELRATHNIVFTVYRLALDFIRPARLDDELSATVAVEAVGRASLQLAQILRRGGEPLARATVHAACVTADGFRPRRIPADILLALTRYPYTKLPCRNKP